MVKATSSPDSYAAYESLDADALRRMAAQLDDSDDLAGFRGKFHLPLRDDGTPQTYLCGMSLGLQPKATADAVHDELRAWAECGVAGHFQGRYPWMPAHEFVRDALAALLGARSNEVVAMNGLTVNLHLMMVSFFRPQGRRRKILIERQAFPSDRYAVVSQLQAHGLDPDHDLIELGGDGIDATLDEEYIAACFDEHGDDIALAILPGVQYYTGQALDLAMLSEAAHRNHIVIGFDLAHAAGNVPLALHDSGCDFAVWCSYKYMNSGPGGVAGCFVHQRHARTERPRFAGWWGNQPENRFRMAPSFQPSVGAEGWQLSNPPILALTPLRTSLELFQQAGMGRLRDKSVRLTGLLEHLLHRFFGTDISIITPPMPARRGCQLSLKFGDVLDGHAIHEALIARGIVGDWRQPNVMRVAPVPLYNRFIDVVEFVQGLLEVTAAGNKER